MRKLILFLLCSLASAQVIVGNFGVKYVSSAPAGSCSQNEAMQVVMGSGVLYTCQLGTWGTVGGGATPGTVTSIATTSPIEGGTITTTGTIACSTCVTSAASLGAAALVFGSGGAQGAATGNADFTYATHTLTMGSAGLFDLSAGAANAFKVPVGAGLTSGANGVIAYDSTAGITHVRTNGADSTAVTATATSTTTTQVLHATAVSGIGAFSAIATGDLPSTVVRTDQVNTAGTAMTLDMSGSTVAGAFRVANIAGATSAADGVIVYDTTQKNTHIRTNGADTLAVAETAAVAATALLKSASSTKSLATASSVLDDGVTVTSAEPYVFGTAAGSPNTDKTIGVLTSAMGAQTTATVTNVTNMTWNVAASKNYVMHCMLPITFAASATIAFAIGGPGTPTSHTIVAGWDLGIAGVFGDISLVNSATYGTKTTASAAVGGTQVVVLDAVIRNGSTASGTALTLQTAANGTNAITMLADGACSLIQTN